MPLVSVIVPAYNAAPWLPETLASICAQTMRDLEVVVIDDGSTDGTGDLVRDHSLHDARVHCIQQRNNGLPSARNAGISSARGRYITFLDADDLWAPEKLACQLASLPDAPGHAVLTSIRRFTGDGGERKWFNETVPPPTDRSRAAIVKLMMLQNTEMVGIATCLARAEDWLRLGGYDRSLRTAEDWDMWLRAARELTMHVVAGVPLQFYRKREGSLTKGCSLDSAFATWRTILLKQQDLGGVTPSDIRRAIAAKHFECAQVYLHEGRKAAAARSLMGGLITDPALLAKRQFYSTCADFAR